MSEVSAVEAVEKAEQEYNLSVREVQKCKDSRSGGPGAEVQRAGAYQVLVRLGVAPQLKLKYRRGKALKQVR